MSFTLQWVRWWYQASALDGSSFIWQYLQCCFCNFHAYPLVSIKCRIYRIYVTCDLETSTFWPRLFMVFHPRVINPKESYVWINRRKVNTEYGFPSERPQNRLHSTSQLHCRNVVHYLQCRLIRPGLHVAAVWTSSRRSAWRRMLTCTDSSFRRRRSREQRKLSTRHHDIMITRRLARSSP